MIEATFPGKCNLAIGCRLKNPLQLRALKVSGCFVVNYILKKSTF